MGFNSFRESLRACSEVYASLKDTLKAKKYAVSVGDEGGFAPSVKSNEEPFILMSEAIKEAGYARGTDIGFGVDVASSEFYEDGKYRLNREGKLLSAKQLADFYKQIAEDYGIISIEDPFSEDDWENFSSFTADIGEKTQIVGDDLYVTNSDRIIKGIREKATNAVLIKPNQIGTLSETLMAISKAREGGQAIVISHRSGETEDSFIADLAVGVGAEEIKTGAPARGERVAKYNRLLEIEEELETQ
jgi:enolase